jgi:hypothetical protein
MPQPATWTADRLTVGRIVSTEQLPEPVSVCGGVAVPLGSGGDRRGCRLAAGVAPQVEQVVGAAQLPLCLARPEAAAQQPAGVLDLAGDWLDGLLPLGVAGLSRPRW